MEEREGPARQAQCSTLPPAGTTSTESASMHTIVRRGIAHSAEKVKGRAQRRKKVGGSTMDWSRLHRRASPLELGVPRGSGPKREVTLEEVAQHCTRDDLWMAISGKVYNCTEYLGFHVCSWPTLQPSFPFAYAYAYAYAFLFRPLATHYPTIDNIYDI